VFSDNKCYLLLIKRALWRYDNALLLPTSRRLILESPTYKQLCVSSYLLIQPTDPLKLLTVTQTAICKTFWWYYHLWKHCLHMLAWTMRHKETPVPPEEHIPMISAAWRKAHTRGNTFQILYRFWQLCLMGTLEITTPMPGQCVPVSVHTCSNNYYAIITNHISFLFSIFQLLLWDYI